MYPSHRDLASVDGNAPLPELGDIISDPRLTWAPSVSSFADMGAEVYYSPSVLLVNTSSITAIFDGTISISVSASSGMLSAVCSLLEQYRNGTRGLLGEDSASIPSPLLQHRCRAGGKVPFPLRSCWQTCGGLQSHSEFPPGVWNDNPADDFQMPNGTNVPVNSSEEDVFCYGMTCKSELGNQPGHPMLHHLLAMHWLERFGHRAKLMPKEPFNLFTTTWKPALIRANLKNTRSYP